jgi:polar amino acid transport system substrate-binding protein
MPTPASPTKRPARLITAACTLWLAAGLCATASARTLQEVLNEGTLRVGVALFTPWTMRASNGDLTGFEIDVAKQLAQDMGLDVDFHVYSWDRIIRALEGGEIDVIAAGLSVTPERALHVNFSNPYAEGGVNLATNKVATAGVEDLNQLNDPMYSIAAVNDSVAEEIVTRVLPKATLKVFATPEEASKQLVAGAVDGYLEDEPVPTFLALENPDKIDTPLSQPLLRTEMAFAVNKGDPDFVFYLNAWITARTTDTWLPTIHDYWFASLRWRKQLADKTSSPR